MYQSKTGLLQGCMTGPAHLELELHKQVNGSWVTVATGEVRGEEKVINYQGEPAYYRWIISGKKGPGRYVLKTNSESGSNWR